MHGELIIRFLVDGAKHRQLNGFVNKDWRFSVNYRYSVFPFNFCKTSSPA